METSSKLNLIRSFGAILLALLLPGFSAGVYAQTFGPGAHTVTVPAGVTSMQVTVTGAAGATYGAGAGGKGGRVTATYSVTAGTTYYIFVGDKSVNNTSGSAGGSSYGGGEDGGKGGTGGSSIGTGGGAASDVRTSIAGGASSTASLNSRIAVGGGGGGAASSGCTLATAGGDGGYPAGSTGGVGNCTSCTPAGGGGGTQSAGGARGSSASCSSAQPGTFGTGGAGGVTISGSPPAGGTGAGGGGWYGGGGAYSGGGGGGSSYASTTGIIGTATFNNGVNTGDGEVIICFSPSSITGPSTVCPGGTIALTNATPGGVWSSGTPAVATVSATGIVYGVSGGNTIISYTVGACPAVMTITVSALGAITGTTTICSGSSTTLSSTTSGGVWSSDNVPVASVSGSVTVTGGTAGTANISYTAGSCAVGTVVTVTGALGPITGPTTTVCSSGTITLSNATTGGVWTSSAPARATIEPSTGIVHGVSAGTTNISYTAGGCSVGTVVTISTLAAITGPTTVCAGATITLNNTTTGGTWSSVNPATATVDPATGVVTGVANGTTSISYTNGSCTVGMAITVGPLPAITGTTTICPGSTSPLSNTAAGGVWTSDNTAVATVSAAGVVTGVAAGTANISYTTGPCAAGVMVTVGSLPGITGPNTVCPGGTITLNNATTGGVWSSSNNARATVDAATGVVSGVTAGSVNISYTSGGCSVFMAVTVGALTPITSATTTLCAGTTLALSNATTGGAWSTSNAGVATVDPVTGVVHGVSGGSVNITYTIGSCNVNIALTVSGSLAAISGPTTVCVGGTIALTNATPGGVWSSDNNPVATVTTPGGVVSGVTTGTANISYTVGTCAVGVAITVNNLPPITGASSVCAGSAIALSNTTPGGVWSSGSPGAATVDPATGVVSGVASGSSTIVYTVGSCTVSTLVTVSAAVPAITGPATVCAGSAISLSNTLTGGVWSSDNSGVAGVSTGGVVTGVSNGTANISYTVGGCFASLAVTVNANSAGTISGPDSVCKGIGHEVTLTSSVPGGVWSSSTTSRATVGPATGLVTGGTTGSVTIRYVVANSCGTYTVTHVMYVRSASRCATGVSPAMEKADAGLSIFPNPNGGTFTAQLSSDEAEEVHIVVTNIVGEKVKEFTTATNTPVAIKLDVSPGIYLISAATAHERHVTKVIVR